MCNITLKNIIKNKSKNIIFLNKIKKTIFLWKVYLKWLYKILVNYKKNIKKLKISLKYVMIYLSIYNYKI